MSKAKTKSPKSQVVAVLEKARVLIKKGWTQGRYAADKNNQTTPFYTNEASKFCVLGALSRAGMEIYITPYDEKAVENIIRNCLPSNSVGLASYNDEPKRKKSEMVALLTKAIEKVKKTKSLSNLI